METSGSPKLRPYHHVYSSTMKPMELTIAGRQALRDQICEECRLIRPGSGAVDVDIERLSVSMGALNAVIDCMLPVVQKEFLYAFGTHNVNRDLYVGRVLCEGRVLPEFATVRGKCRVIVRGSRAKGATYTTCAKCGTALYSAHDESYLCPAPPDDIALCESDLAGIVVRDDVFKAVGHSAGSCVAYQRLHVLTVPEDGFPGLKSVDCNR